MERLNTKFEYKDVMQEDELEARKSAAKTNKKKIMRRKRRRKGILLLMLLVLFGIYMFSDYSNIRVIDINGNTFYTKEQLLEIADIDLAQKSILAPSFLIEKRLKQDTLIMDVSVHKSWDGIVRIDLVEENVVGYYTKDKKTYLMLKGEEDIKFKDERLLAFMPYINNLNDKQREQYKQNIQSVNEKNILMISEVTHYETTYDKNMLKLYMQDGHVVLTTMDGLKLLDKYLEMLKSLNTTHKCITFVEETNSSYSEKCE